MITSTINHHAGVGEGGLDTATGAGAADTSVGTSDARDAAAETGSTVGAAGEGMAFSSLFRYRS